MRTRRALEDAGRMFVKLVSTARDAAEPRAPDYEWGLMRDLSQPGSKNLPGLK